MRNKFEHLLLSILLGLTVLLGLSFWLNTIFNFNIFCGTHWDELSKLQASHIPVSQHFYISIAIAIFIFMFGLYLIYRQEIHSIHIQRSKKTDVPEISQQIIKQNHTQIAGVQMVRPPRLNLPKNMLENVVQNNANITKHNENPSINPYTKIISEIFSANGYLVKQNPSISGFIPNLFAIGNKEVLWIGAVDCDAQKMLSAIEQLQSIFTSMLEDITINVNAFILDTMDKQVIENNPFLIFKTIDELKEFITTHPAIEIDEYEQGNFDAYSEFIDTIIKYVKNI